MAAAPERISDEEVAALLEKDGKESAHAVRPYDFAVQRINRTQLPLLEAISKNFADRAGASLSQLLGRDAGMHFESLESVKSADLQASLPVPATLAVVRLKPLPGFAYVSVEPALLLTLLDGFFGGTGRANADPQAATAPAAQRFLALMLRSVAADVASAWQPVSPVELELVKQETNPRLVQLGGQLDSVVVAKFSVEFAARSGRMEWLFPDAMLEPIRDALAGDGGSAPVRKQEPWAPTLTSALQEAQMDTRAVLAQAQISLRQLVSLAPGDIIPIEAPQQVTLFAGDVPLYRGRFGISQGRNALKILPGAPV
ncbi:MAG: flagellar motor switch protein FliM [Gammaproteobacteria bacterium]|jgi:flagellar motor switch protein FliM|nr:flagellar motor switch protein FliM [Gammaproteobacteria bacterium]